MFGKTFLKKILKKLRFDSANPFLEAIYPSKMMADDLTVAEDSNGPYGYRQVKK